MNERRATPLPGLMARTQMEQREAELLAPYAMHSADTRGRRYDEPTLSNRGIYRSAYQRDRDRIVHCTAFRRLEYKTQVFVNHEGDYYRTRLTHSLEVAQISRQIARTLLLNEDLCEAVALAHDMGHTPFGHSGEEVLGELMAHKGGFEHNRQGLRVVDLLERRYPNFPGLNLTYEVRESLLKHHSRYDWPDDGEFNSAEMPLLEAQVIDAADEIAYNNHDLDDGLAAGILDEHDLNSNVGLWAEAYEHVERLDPGAPPRRKVLQTIAALINEETVDLMEQSFRLLQDHNIASVADVRSAGSRLIRFSPGLQTRRQQLQQYLLANLYRHYRVTRMANKAKRFIRELFNEYTQTPEELPPEFQGWAEQVGLERGVCDYIAGMTDRFAQDEYRRLFYPYERV